jgi:zinc and cadmium transporter
MNNIWFYSLVSVFLVSLVSFVGIFGLAFSTKKLNTILIYLVSFSTGALFGDTFIHLLPDVARKNGFSLTISLSVLAGILMFFVLEKIVHWRHKHTVEEGKKIKSFTYVFAVGDALHNFIDGAIIAASYVASMPIGLATTIAVVLHEIPQEVGDFAVLVKGGLSKTKALMVNFFLGLIAIAGAVVALWLTGFAANVEQILIPIAAGGFIYVAGSDLIPELHKERTLWKSLLQIISIVAGILIMLAFSYL